MGAAKAVQEQPSDECRYHIRYPQVADYGRLSTDKINRLGDFVEDVKRAAEPAQWYDEAIERAKDKGCVAHDCFPWNAEAALRHVQRDAARLLFSQFVPVNGDIETPAFIGSFPPPVVTVTQLIESEDEGSEPERLRGPAEWTELLSTDDGREAAMREAVSHVWGYRAWVAQFPELEFLLKAMCKAARKVDLLA